MHQTVGTGRTGNRKTADPELIAILAILLGMAGGSAGMFAWQTVTAHPIHFAGITIDRLSSALTILVASVGAVTFRFSLRYLDGEARRRQFLRWLSFTVVAAFVLMLSTNLLLLFASWSLTSFGLHELLTFYRNRKEARPPARKKFLISRLGDLALISALVMIWQGWGTLDLHIFLRNVVAEPEGSHASIVGLLVAVAALTKSAQFPFHSWLPETMESPTPVSALMHAGIINAGGALLLRFAPLIVRVPEALFLLTFIGTLTVTLGMLAMWAQVKIKRTLAWSTVSQMGFMMIQCGLAAFPVAALHILGHGFYKAWSFLRSGDLPPSVSTALPASPTRTLVVAALGTGLSVPAITLASTLTGYSPFHSPGELALSAILALSMGQLWVALLTAPLPGWVGLFGRVVSVFLSTLVVPIAALALYRGAELFLAPVLGDLPPPSGPLAWGSATLPVVALAALAVVHAFLPTLARTSSGRAFFVHALHGFYFGAMADRLVGHLGPLFPSISKEVTRG